MIFGPEQPDWFGYNGTVSLSLLGLVAIAAALVSVLNRRPSGLLPAGLRPSRASQPGTDGRPPAGC